MRILSEGSVELEEGETIPACCPNCNYLWQPKIEPSDKEIICPLCSAKLVIDKLPAWEGP